MRKSIINFLYIFTVVFVIAACNDPIFYTISLEVKPVDPRIKGSPSNFVAIGNTMYVASGTTVHSYNIDNGSWSTITRPGDRILQLAATGGNLYALCYKDNSSGIDFFIRQYNGSWITIAESTGESISNVSIFAVGSYLFIGGETPGVTGELIGAYYDGTANYYIATKDDGIFKLNSSLTLEKEITHEDGKDFMGMVELNNTTLALITRSGEIFTLSTSSDNLTKTGISFSNRKASGALTVWKEGAVPKLLLAGRQEIGYSMDAGYTYGYMELELDATGITGTAFKEPGTGGISTVSDNERYISTIGKHPVNHIFQAPDGVLFASTQKNGVWSYRDRSGGWQWNAEE